LLISEIIWCLNRLLPTVRLGDVAAFENRQPIAAAKFITKSSLFIQLLGVIRRLELKPISKLPIDLPSALLLQIPSLAVGLKFLCCFLFVRKSCQCTSKG